MYRAILIGILLTLTLPSLANPSLIQNPGARASTSLDGEWNIIVDPYENGFYNHRYEEHARGYFVNDKMKNPSDLVEYNFARSKKLQVPGDWNSQMEKLFLYEGTVWYHKDFSINKKKQKRYFLYFGAANYEAIVYLNGEKLGSHIGGFTPFQFEVSNKLKNGNNFVVVKVDNSRALDQVPTVNTDWWNYGGLTRPVKLIEVNASYIADYQFQLENPQQIRGWVQLAGDKKLANQQVELAIPELKINKRFSTDQNGYVQFTISATPELWQPQNPKLYDIKLQFGDEQVSDRIGFRTVEVKGEDILLNGKSVYLRGISLHEEAPNREGRAWSEQDARTTLTWAKELGCNFVRLAHYPHNEAILKMADEMGLMVWSEIPVYWTIQFENSAVYANAENQLTEMISRDKNRVSIILWSVANETPSHDARFTFLEKLVTKTRELDSSRLVTAALDTQTRKDGLRIIDDPFAGLVDVIGINQYCGWYGHTPEYCASIRWESPYGKPVIISEFGGGALHGKHGKANERWTEEYQAAVYEHNITMIKNMNFVRGTTPWILKDFRSPRRPLPDIQDFWNRKGLLSETGERKLAWQVLHDFYESLISKE